MGRLPPTQNGRTLDGRLWMNSRGQTLDACCR
jgi:hypothetical protein